MTTPSLEGPPMETAYDFHHHRNRRAAKRRRDALLPWAHLRLPTVGPIEGYMTAHGASVMNHVHIDRLAGVHIYRDPDGWRYGLVYKDMPPGSPLTVVATDPYETEAEAVLGAIDAVTYVLMVSQGDHPIDISMVH
jgi:hypothetical protein